MLIRIRPHKEILLMLRTVYLQVSPVLSAAQFPSILSWHVPIIPKHLSLAKFIVWLSPWSFL